MQRHEDSGKPLLGAHVSIAGGIENAIARGEEIGCTAIQIFTGNASRWQVKALSAEAIANFRAAWQQSSISTIAAHDSYLINLASPDEALREKSMLAFIAEMQRCQKLGIRNLVMHPGAHMGKGVESGLQTLADSFRAICHQAPSSVRILLENTAGQGTCLGSRFEELARLIELVPEAGFAVCLDTCHAYAAGYDLASAAGYADMMRQFDDLIGTEKIALFHLNDSKKGPGSRVDRHDHVGQGMIGPDAFQRLMQDQRFRDVAKIIETPSGDEHHHDLENLALLKGFYHEQKGACVRCVQ